MDEPVIRAIIIEPKLITVCSKNTTVFKIIWFDNQWISLLKHALISSANLKILLSRE